MSLEIRVAPVSGNRLVEDYVTGDTALAPFFPGSPFDPDAYRRKADEVRARFDADALRAAASALRPLGDDARRRIDDVAAGRGFIVTTGQQPGLFGGPLYTVYKALTAVALARRLEATLDAPVLAVFWVASDDHDWAEANHAYVLDTANELRRLELEGEAEPRRSMGRRPLDGGATNALDQLAQVLPPSDFTPGLLDRLKSAWNDATVAGAFAETIAGLLEGLPLALVDPQDPVVRERAAPLLARELESAASHERALAEQTAKLEAAGYGAQVPILAGASNVFHEDETGRERLVREDGGWRLRASGRRLADAEVRDLLEEAPERFSANVVLRPVVESAVLPTLAYVGGPGEVSYLAQTGCLFAAHGVGMPLVHPRLSVTLVEGKVGKVLEKYGLGVAEFRRPVHELVSEAVRDEVPAAVETALSGLRQAVQEGYQAVFEAAKTIDPTLKGPIFGARTEGFKAIAEVEKKVRQHVKLRNETGLEQLEKAARNLAPLGKPQERVLNVHHYLARYGGALLPAVLDRMEVRLDGNGAGWAGVRCG